VGAVLPVHMGEAISNALMFLADCLELDMNDDVDVMSLWTIVTEEGHPLSKRFSVMVEQGLRIEEIMRVKA
jgi:hypothetical protein